MNGSYVLPEAVYNGENFKIKMKVSDLKGLNYIGKHSITFYFLSGVMPAFFSTIAHHLHHTNIPYLYGVVALFSLAGACIATYIIGRYLPFLLDLRRLRKK